MEMVIGVATGVVASCLFLANLTRLRPRLQISPKASVYQGQQETRYAIKVINRSRRSAVNVPAGLARARSKNAPQGVILSTKTIPLRKRELFILPGFCRSDRESAYANRIATSENLDELWRDEESERLRPRIYAQDEVSGFDKAFLKDYRLKRHTFVQGELEFGPSEKIC